MDVKIQASLAEGLRGLLPSLLDPGDQDLSVGALGSGVLRFRDFGSFGTLQKPVVSLHLKAKCLQPLREPSTLIHKKIKTNDSNSHQTGSTSNDNNDSVIIMIAKVMIVI